MSSSDAGMSSSDEGRLYTFTCSICDQLVRMTLTTDDAKAYAVDDDDDAKAYAVWKHQLCGQRCCLRECFIDEYADLLNAQRGFRVTGGMQKAELAYDQYENADLEDEGTSFDILAEKRAYTRLLEIREVYQNIRRSRTALNMPMWKDRDDDGSDSDATVEMASPADSPASSSAAAAAAAAAAVPQSSAAKQGGGAAVAREKGRGTARASSSHEDLETTASGLLCCAVENGKLCVEADREASARALVTLGYDPTNIQRP